MRAVILAAGEGSRFRRTVGFGPKPLYPLYGVTLLERAVRCARQAGCDEVVVVLGAEGEVIRRRLLSRLQSPEAGAAPGPGVRWVEAAQWRRGNGASLLAARPLLGDEPFLLMMADHVMDPGLCRRAAEAARDPRRAALLSGGGALLLVDPRLDQVHDLDEATRVRHQDGRVIAIGKGLEPYTGVDTGVFVGSPGLLDALEEVRDRAGDDGPVTLTEGAALLAAAGRLGAVPVDQGWWLDVDDADDLPAARQRLLASACASGGDGPVARHLNRPVSRRLTALLASTPVTPDMITWAAALLAAAGAACFALGLPAAGGILAQLASIVDGSDGELARLRLEARPSGALLDTLLDRYADALLIAGLTLGALGAPGTPGASGAPGALGALGGPGGAWLPLLAGFLALAGAPLSALVKDRLQWLAGSGRRYNPLRDDPAWLRWLPVNRDGRCLVILLCGLAGAPVAALLILALASHVGAWARVVHGLQRLQARS
ncbi:MAG: NTP transferase domain-containing protein [Bacillota bacterium]|nr:CDP-alcohol phosphatidyltransferase [Bacillota bacterium]